MTLLLVLLAPAFTYAIVFCGVRLRKRSERSVTASRARRAARNLIRQLRRGRFMPDELTLAVRNYLDDRFDLSLGSVTSDDAVRILESNGVQPDTARHLGELLGRIEDAVYSGKGREPFEAAEEIPKIIKQIEKEIR
jgi:hypothetical protein